MTTLSKLYNPTPQQREALLELARVLEDVPEDNAEDDWFPTKLGNVQFNMYSFHRSKFGCGSVCCALGIGARIHSDKIPGSYPEFGGECYDIKSFCDTGNGTVWDWCFSSDWTFSVASTGKDAAHRLYYLIQLDPSSDVSVSFTEDDFSRSFWGTFTKDHPFEETKAAAIAATERRLQSE